MFVMTRFKFLAFSKFCLILLRPFSLHIFIFLPYLFLPFLPYCNIQPFFLIGVQNGVVSILSNWQLIISIQILHNSKMSWLVWMSVYLYSHHHGRVDELRRCSIGTTNRMNHPSDCRCRYTYVHIDRWLYKKYYIGVSSNLPIQYTVPNENLWPMYSRFDL